MPSPPGKTILGPVKHRDYQAFVAIREEFRALVSGINSRAPWLSALQDVLRIDCGYDDYAIETPVVFNGELDDVGPETDPRFIVVADNPGKKEQLSINRRYLVGQSGKLAAGWFDKELGLDFRKEVIILNKTPIHTPKTAELRKLLAVAGPRRKELAVMLEESQVAMARLAFRLHACLGCPVWISGYGELGSRGLFFPYAREITRLYASAPERQRDALWLFRHFSMNQFAIEMRLKADPVGDHAAEDSNTDIPPADPRARTLVALRRIGTENRKRILGF